MVQDLGLDRGQGLGLALHLVQLLDRVRVLDLEKALRQVRLLGHMPGQGQTLDQVKGRVLDQAKGKVKDQVLDLDQVMVRDLVEDPMKGIHQETVLVMVKGLDLDLIVVNAFVTKTSNR